MGQSLLDAGIWELASYIVTVIGLPVAIIVFLIQQGKERHNEADEIYLLLSNSYNDFLRVVLDNPDLHLRSQQATPNLTAEQRERMLTIFDMLISLLERAYLFSYKSNASGEQLRRWNAWEDFMREWVRRDDFHQALPELLTGEDPEFAAYLRRLATEERGAGPTPTPSSTV